MRWKAKKEYKVGDTRWTNKFFFFPQCFHDTWVWLEWGKVHQKRVETYTYVMGCCAVPQEVWKDIAIANV